MSQRRLIRREGRKGTAVLVDEGLELLDEPACWELLSRAPIGRVAVSVGALPAIFPVNFVVDGTSIVFRTGAGTKLAAAVERSVVAFEADSFDTFEHTGWSVMAVGHARAVTEPEECARLGRLRVAAWAGGDRDSFVRVPVEFLSGRRITRIEEEGG